jgi:general secretion pathway protein A
MYLQFYGLRDIPFSLTPDPRYLYFTASHREVMANLSYGIQYGKGLIVTTGEVGTGKTTMLRTMLTKLDRSVLCSYIFNPGLTVPDLYQQMGADFGLGLYTSKSEMLMKLGKMFMMRHSRGLRTVLIVDEAQGLSRDLLEEIRLLLNFETYSEKQLQIILVGQPELRQLLNSADLRQLKQRISLRCEIKPLKAEEVGAYIRARLKVAGASRLNLFAPDAVAMIYRASEGIPRLVNNICDNALLTGYAMNAKTITPAIVAEIADALDLLRPMIEDDPRMVMESSLPPLPVMSEHMDENPLPRSLGSQIAEKPPPRRRSNTSARRRKSRHQDMSLLRQDQIETMRLKVISVTDGDHEVEDEIKAG